MSNKETTDYDKLVETLEHSIRLKRQEIDEIKNQSYKSTTNYKIKILNVEYNCLTLPIQDILFIIKYIDDCLFINENMIDNLIDVKYLVDLKHDILNLINKRVLEEKKSKLSVLENKLKTLYSQEQLRIKAIKELEDSLNLL